MSKAGIRKYEIELAIEILYYIAGRRQDLRDLRYDCLKLREKWASIDFYSRKNKVHRVGLLSPECYEKIMNRKAQIDPDKHRE